MSLSLWVGTTIASNNGQHNRSAALFFSLRIRYNRHTGYIKLHRGYYMRACILMTLLNELGKSDKMQGLPTILSLFLNKFK